MKEETVLTYSSIMRFLNKNYPEKVNEFRGYFKKAFDEGYLKEINDFEQIALIEALKKANINYEEINE